MLMRQTVSGLRQFPPWLSSDDLGRPLSRPVITLARISLRGLPTLFFSGSAEELHICYTRADRQRDPVKDVPSTRQCSRSFHVHCACIPHNEAFTARWICRGTVTSPSPSPWPPGSPGLTTDAKILWGIVGNKVAVHSYNTNTLLRAAVTSSLLLTPGVVGRCDKGLATP